MASSSQVLFTFEFAKFHTLLLLSLFSQLPSNSVPTSLVSEPKFDMAPSGGKLLLFLDVVYNLPVVLSMMLLDAINLFYVFMTCRNPY